MLLFQAKFSKSCIYSLYFSLNNTFKIAFQESCNFNNVPFFIEYTIACFYSRPRYPTTKFFLPLFTGRYILALYCSFESWLHLNVTWVLKWCQQLTICLLKNGLLLHIRIRPQVPYTIDNSKINISRVM